MTPGVVRDGDETAMSARAVRLDVGRHRAFAEVVGADQGQPVIDEDKFGMLVAITCHVPAHKVDGAGGRLVQVLGDPAFCVGDGRPLGCFPAVR